MKKYVNMYTLITNIISLTVCLPILIILVASTVNIPQRFFSIIMYYGIIIGPILAVENVIVQHLIYKKYMKNEAIGSKKMREYLFMVNSPFIAAFHGFIHFAGASVVIGTILLMMGMSFKAFLIAEIDSILLALFTALIDYYITQLIFFKKLRTYKLTKDEFNELNPKIRHISLKWKFIITINFIILFAVYTNLMVRDNIILLFAILAINVILSFILTMTVVKPINDINDYLSKMVGGKITSLDRLPIMGTGEIGRMTANFNILLTKITSLLKMMMNISEELSSLTGQLASTGEQITASSEEVSATIQNISIDMNNQNEMVKSAEDEINKIKSLSDSVKSKVNMSQTASKKANNSSSEGLEKVFETIDNYDLIVNNVDSALGRIKMLQSRSEQIDEILDIITKISEQTDLLALNAAIEAARVGEYGKGFTVVAEEIRELAEQSSLSTRRIASLIKEISNDIEQTVKLITNQHKNVKDGKLLMNQTQEQFEQISKAITLTVNMIKEISYASEEQMVSIKGYIGKIVDISDLSARTSTNTEEIAASIEEQSASMEEVLSNVQEIDGKTASLKNAENELNTDT